MTVATSPVSPQLDPRFAAFIAEDGPEVFSGIVHANQIWTPDPFDVETIHAEARETFARLLNRAAGSEPPPYGKSLLLRGEAGSGKTHLMRAFRHAAHSACTGYCGYMQMTTRTDSYARYVLSKLIDGLEEPYLPPATPSGLTRLARGLLDSLTSIPAEDRRRFCEEPHEPAELVSLVEHYADAAMKDDRYAKQDHDLIRALLFLLPGDGRIRTRVLKWLRCEDLARFDRDMLGDLVPRPQEEKPLAGIVALGRLMAVVHQAALVLCVDQLEEMISLAAAEERPGELFRRAVDVLVTVAEEVPTAVIVVACLEDYYIAVRDRLAKPKLDRLTKDPEPIVLSSHRTEVEISAVIAKRLEVLYAAFNAAIDKANSTFPFTAAHIQKLSGLQTRDILDFCREHHEACVLARRWLNPSLPKAGEAVGGPEEKKSLKTFALEQRWNDFKVTPAPPALDDEAVLADLLSWTINAVSAEMPDGLFFSADPNGTSKYSDPIWTYLGRQHPSPEVFFAESP